MAETKYDRVTCYSLNELVDLAKDVRDTAGTSYDGYHPDDSEWVGATWDECEALATLGWTEKLDETLTAVASAISLVEREVNLSVFEPTLGVAGNMVDMGRYLAGDPRNMWSFPMVEVPAVGRVVTLCASVCYSSGCSHDEIIRRGMVVSAFAFALERLGLGVEMWADATTNGERDRNPSVLVRLKGAHDYLDPSRVLYAYAHPSMLRRLCFAAGSRIPGYQERYHGNIWCRYVADPGRDALPEGTIYLDGMRWEGRGHVTGIADDVKALLKKAGIMA